MTPEERAELMRMRGTNEETTEEPSGLTWSFSVFGWQIIINVFNPNK